MVGNEPLGGCRAAVSAWAIENLLIPVRELGLWDSISTDDGPLRGFFVTLSRRFLLFR